jgi:hypothetical protein
LNASEGKNIVIGSPTVIVGFGIFGAGYILIDGILKLTAGSLEKALNKNQ